MFEITRPPSQQLSRALGGMLVHQAYQFALDPTPQQQGALASHCGAARYAFNWALKLVQRRLDERGAGLDVEVPWRLPALRREWNRAKQQVAPWWWENSKEAYNSGLDALARACRTGRTPRRAGEGSPRRLPPAQGETPHPADLPVHHWRDPCGTRPASCSAAPHRADPHPRVHQKARPPAGSRYGPDPVSDDLMHRRPLVRLVHGRGPAPQP
jgi:hypothetical protein